jgi:hypothetical protein
MSYNYIDIILNFLNPDGNEIKIKIENTGKYHNIYHYKKRRIETNFNIEWIFCILNNEYKLSYNKKTEEYTSMININNKFACFNFIDNAWLKKNNLIEDGKIYINEKCEYYYIGKNYIFALMFITGISYEELKYNNEIAKIEINKKNLIKNNFFVKFLTHCKKISENIYSFPTEVKEYKLNDVTFEYNENTDVEIDELLITWKVRVIIDYIDEKTKEKKNIISERSLNYCHDDDMYYCDVKVGKPMCDISYLYPKWCEKKNIIFDGNFYVALNFLKIEDKIFRLETQNPCFAFMTFINANYDEIIKSKI